MEPRYIAVIGCNHYYGTKILKPGMLLRLNKEPDNEYDAEAIAVALMPVGKVGYVANSTHTVPRGCCSAGRIYDTFDEYAYAVVRFVTQDIAIAELFEESIIHYDIKVEVNEEIWEKDENKSET